MMRDLKIKLAATYSPALAVPSALEGLTSVFGMGTGEPSAKNHLKALYEGLVVRF